MSENLLFKFFNKIFDKKFTNLECQTNLTKLIWLKLIWLKLILSQKSLFVTLYFCH